MEIPRVIYNRARLYSQGDKRTLQQLVKTGRIVFNQWNLYGKLYLYELLTENKKLRPYLPQTLPFDKDHLNKCIDQWTSFFVKPNKGSVGMGIKKATKLSDGEWELQYVKHGVRERKVMNKEALTAFLTSALSRRHHIQETIPLARWKGAPFDIRISVQKGMDGTWKVPGMVAKVAAKGNFLTNVAQGGKCYPLESILDPPLKAPKIKDHLEEVAIQFVKYLDGKIPHLADVGFDFGIDQKGHPYFIEMNLRDQRKCFVKGKMLDVWGRLFESPLAYGRYLLNQCKKQKGSKSMNVL
nr:YheC/YheD family protein [Ammoniphilus resinae]